MKQYKQTFKELKNFLLLWSTQSLSALGSTMTNFALIVWSYGEAGSALSTALLSVCSYAPYVLMSVFAGAIGNKWNKKAVMLTGDAVAAAGTVTVALLLRAGRLNINCLYFLNALNGLMNTFQQPASDVAASLLTPKKYYQKTSGLRAFSNSLTNVLTPAAATALLSFAGLHAVILFDLATFSLAFLTLAFFIRLPSFPEETEKTESVFLTMKAGFSYLKANRGILDLILFLAAINFTASVYNAALPAFLMNLGGGQNAYGTVNTVCGLAMLAGSVLATLLPKPKSRTKVICNALLLSMSTENFFLAFGKTLPAWCIGGTLGWLGVPLMNANMDALFREYIPLSMQGRVYSVRNTLQFFTIPLGYAAGGLMVDAFFEPFMAAQAAKNGFSLFVKLFGSGKGSGAAFLFFILGILGVATCLIFRKDKAIRALEKDA